MEAAGSSFHEVILHLVNTFDAHRKTTIVVYAAFSGVVLKNEVGERLEIEVETVAKSAILQEFCIV